MKCLSRSSSGAKLVAGNVAPTMCVPAVALKRTRIGGAFRPKPKPAAAPSPVPALPVPRRARCAGATAATAVGRRVPATTLPVHDPETLAVEQHLDPLAWHRAESGRRHVVAEDRRDRERVLAVRGERVRHQHAAARAERQPLDVIVLRGVFTRAIDDERRLLRISHREPADLLRCRDVGLDLRGRNAQCAGDVVEARGRVVRRADTSRHRR